MNTPDEIPQPEHVFAYERARFFLVASWLLRVGWFCTVWDYIWLGWGLFAVSAWLDSFVPRPRPRLTFCKTRISDWVLLLVFAVCAAGMLMFREYTMWFLAFGVIAASIVLFEAFHYARTDVRYLLALRDAGASEEGSTYEEAEDYESVPSQRPDESDNAEESPESKEPEKANEPHTPEAPACTEEHGVEEAALEADESVVRGEQQEPNDRSKGKDEQLRLF